MSEQIPADAVPLHEAPEPPALPPHQQAAVEAEQAMLSQHMEQAQLQAQVAYLAQRLHALTCENADLREQLKKG